MKRISDFVSLIWNLLDGYKTYVGIAIAFVAGGLYSTGHIDEATKNALILFGGSVAAVGFRSALKKIE